MNGYFGNLIPVDGSAENRMPDWSYWTSLCFGLLRASLAGLEKKPVHYKFMRGAHDDDVPRHWQWRQRSCWSVVLWGQTDGQRPHRRQPVTFLNYWLLLHEHRTGRRRRQWPGECLMIRINIDTQRESPKLCHFRKGDNLWMTVKWPGNATSSCPDFKASNTNNLVLIQRVAVMNFWRLFKK